MDTERYQTVFAKHAGSVAAPTAGLHATETTLARLRARGVATAFATLHVGVGTFRPVSTDDLDDHVMHEERFSVSPELERAVGEARSRGGAVVAVGTTVVRSLESARDPADPLRVRATTGSTRLLIQPGYRFGPVDALLTNFHMPKSTLLALVAAFMGRERMLAAYRAALGMGYRFLSYGDAMWVPERLS
jgi:S-adenosylmethionine:tRNA ribosyltransferase-isomerase